MGRQESCIGNPDSPHTKHGVDPTGSPVALSPALRSRPLAAAEFRRTLSLHKVVPTRRAFPRGERVLWRGKVG